MSLLKRSFCILLVSLATTTQAQKITGVVPEKYIEMPLGCTKLSVVAFPVVK